MNAQDVGLAAAELDLGFAINEGPEGWVLLIAPPQAFHAPLCEALERRGFGVVIRSSLREAIEATRAGLPRCFVCDGDLQQGAGLEIARALRADCVLGVVPVVCFTADEARRVGALATVADAALSKNSPADAAAAQIDALVRLADRIGDGEASPPASGLAGDLAQVSLQTLMDVFALERRTGTLAVVSGDLCAEVRIVDGCAVDARLQGQPQQPLAALRATLPLRVGRFSFSTEASVGAPCDTTDLRELTIEALRLADEANHAAAQSREGRRRRQGGTPTNHRRPRPMAS
jgi:ActR/RegA family two-component response regulator